MKKFKDMTFVEKLQELKGTLQEAMQAENSKLEMYWWISTPPEKPKHFCNTVCCIMGYQAIKEADSLDDVAEKAVSLTRDLENTDDLAARSLAKSIYLPKDFNRKYWAVCSMLFSKEELDNINHLNMLEPSFQDAIDYLDICITKTKYKD